MTRPVLIDEIHVEVLVPRRLAGRDLRLLRRALTNRAFLPAVRRPLRPVFRADPQLAAVRLRVTR